MKLARTVEFQVVGAKNTRPGELILARRISNCDDLADANCFEPLKVIPIIAKNFRLGTRVGASVSATEDILTIHNWNKTKLVKLFGTYRGVSALSLELSVFFVSLNLKAADAALMNTSGVVVMQGPTASLNQTGTPSADLLSYRSLEIIPIHNNQEMKPKDIPDIQLFNAKEEPAKQPPSPITARTSPRQNSATSEAAATAAAAAAAEIEALKAEESAIGETAAETRAGNEKEEAEDSLAIQGRADSDDSQSPTGEGTEAPKMAPQF